MDPASSLPTPGQPQGFFPYARDLSFVGGVFNDIRGGVHYNTTRQGNVRLLSFS